MKIYLFAATFLLLLSCGSDNGSAAAEEATPLFYGEARSLMESDAPATPINEALMQNFKLVTDPETGTLNEAASREFVELAEQLSDRYPNDTAAAMPLYRGAEVVRAMNDPTKAAQFYQKVYERYPSFSRAPEALFMLGFTYDEDLGDLKAAEARYKEFIEKYPTHGFADDSEMLLRNLGKSDEEILRELEKGN